MNKSMSLRIWMEVIWWVITALVVVAVLYLPETRLYKWPFRTWNIIYIVTLVTLVRYIFLLPYTLIAERQVLKIALMLLMFPLLFKLIEGLNMFLTYIEEKTWEPITGGLYVDDKRNMEQFLWNEMLFFAVGSIISAPVFAVRMFVSIWRFRNRGEV